MILRNNASQQIATDNTCDKPKQHGARGGGGGDGQDGRTDGGWWSSNSEQTTATRGASPAHTEEHARNAAARTSSTPERRAGRVGHAHMHCGMRGGDGVRMYGGVGWVVVGGLRVRGEGCKEGVRREE